MNLKRKASSCNASIAKYFKSNTQNNNIPNKDEPNTIITNSKISENQASSLETTLLIQTDPAVGKNLYEFNKKPIRPKLIKYEPNNSGRTFSIKWYENYAWLEYSKSKHKAFCHTCRIFGVRNGNFELAYISDGFSDWAHATVRFVSHENSEIHKAAAIRLISRIDQDNKNSLINSEIETIRALKVKKNRENLRIIISSCLWLAKQGLALRGNDEGVDSENRGNFKELLTLRRNDLDMHKDEAKFSYTHPINQNEIIDLISSQIKNKIIDEVQNRPFSIICDETSDIANHEQVAFILRYADDNLNIQERFLGFYKTGSTTGEALETLIESIIKELGISASEFLVGQGYDGAANMSGDKKGVAARIRAKIPRAFYVHCACHLLNLALQDSCSTITEVRNCLGTVNSVCSFLEGSPKRHEIFQNLQLNSKTITLKLHSDTRWSSRKNSVHSIIDSYEYVLDALIYIDLNDKSVSASKAGPLYNSMIRFEFQFVLRLLYEIFERTNILTKLLQQKEIEFDKLQKLKQITIELLRVIRTAESFSKIYNNCIEFAKEKDLELPSLGRFKRIPARFRDTLVHEPSFNSVEEKYKDLYYQIIDKNIYEISERLNYDCLNVMNCFTRILKAIEEPDDVEKIKSLNFYNDLVDFKKLSSELLYWKKAVDILRNENLDSYDSDSIVFLAKSFNKNKLFVEFPQIEKLFRIYLAFPITSAAAERGFSTLKRILTWLRNTMGQNRLSNLAIISIEKGFAKDIDIDEIIDKFASLKDRRTQFF